jgi:ribonuclease HI
MHFISVTNNTVKYEAMIASLRIAKEIEAQEFNMFNNSQLAVRLVNDEARC